MLAWRLQIRKLLNFDWGWIRIKVIILTPVALTHGPSSPLVLGVVLRFVASDNLFQCWMIASFKALVLLHGIILLEPSTLFRRLSAGLVSDLGRGVHRNVALQLVLLLFYLACVYSILTLVRFDFRIGSTLFAPAQVLLVLASEFDWVGRITDSQIGIGLVFVEPTSGRASRIFNSFLLIGVLRIASRQLRMLVLLLGHLRLRHGRRVQLKRLDVSVGLYCFVSIGSVRLRRSWRRHPSSLGTSLPRRLGSIGCQRLIYKLVVIDLG